MTVSKKNVIYNIIGSFSTALISLILMIVVTRINGVDDAGIFTYSFATACLFYLIGTYIGRTFQVTDIKNKYSDTDYLYNRIFTCLIMLIISCIFVIVRGYDFYKSTIFILLCAYKMLEAFCEVIYGFFQKNNKLYIVGISMFVKSIIGISTFIIIDLLFSNLILSICSLILSYILLILIYDLKNLKKIKINKTKFSIKQNNSILKIGFLVFIFTFLSLYIMNAPRYAIDTFFSNELQTIYGIIIMPATFMGLLGQFILQPYLNVLNDYILKKEYKNMMNSIFKCIGLIIIFGIVVIIIAYFLGITVLEFIYGLSLSLYFKPFMIIIIGSILYSLAIFISNVLVSLRKIFSQTIIFIIITIFAYFISNYFVYKYQLLGASYAYFVIMLLQSISVLIILLYNKRRLKE